MSNILHVPDTKVPPTNISSNSTTRITLALEEQVLLGLQENDTVFAVDSNLAVQGIKFNSSAPQDETVDGVGFGILTDSDRDLSNNSTRVFYKEIDTVLYRPGYIFLANETVKTWLGGYKYNSWEAICCVSLNSL